MEREIMITGIGGQGVQLAGQILARAAAAEDREVMMLGTYGGTMRGGNTESVVVVGDRPLVSPPIVSQIGSALLMHHLFWETTRAKLRPRSLLLVNSSLFEGELDSDNHDVVEVPATSLADEAGLPLAGSLVLLGAYAAITDLVGLPALIQGLKESLPPYRAQHLPLNQEALRLGFESAPKTRFPAWDAEPDPESYPTGGRAAGGQASREVRR